MWDLLQAEEECDDTASGQGGSQEQLFLALSLAACSGVEARSTMCFQGSVQGRDALILIDSGSSATFVSSAFASGLSGIVPLSKLIGVNVADGTSIHCDSQILNVAWSVQGCVFQSDLKILPLLHYDLIVGMDWLEACSPMKVY